MQRSLMVLMMLVVSLGVAFAANLEPQVLPGNKLVLPEALTQLVAERFPELKIPVAENFRGAPGKDSTNSYLPSGELVYYPEWSWALKENEVPWACWGDFNGDSLTDVTLMLIPQAARFENPNPDSAQPNLVIFHQTKTGYEVFTPWTDFPPDWWDYAIKTMPPGKIPPLPATSSPREYEIPTPYASIEWYMYGASSCRFYWENGTYQQAWTGD